ncbi:hypothetical protein L1987_65790 [Smallanthus sonchifolius]|uniref:Uncharacterized protein n=1 Tax=Smallanthus sonchifolius TaxID=185202 RepID=A0ACB9BVM7_9ASTR|nr:hypothetical protein L1987_65790 [Smallanthus sonchifolius]
MMPPITKLKMASKRISTIRPHDNGDAIEAIADLHHEAHFDSQITLQSCYTVTHYLSDTARPYMDVVPHTALPCYSATATVLFFSPLMALLASFSTTEKTNHNFHKFGFTLSQTNYGYWKTMLQHFFITNNLFGYIDGTIPCPPTTIQSATSSAKDAEPVTQPNPNYSIWVSNDAHIRMLIMPNISESAFQHVQGTTSRELWLSLERAFAPQMSSREYTLKTKLLKLQIKDDETPSAYLARAQGYANALANIELHGLLSDHDYSVKKPDSVSAQAFTATTGQPSAPAAVNQPPTETLHALQQLMSQLGVQIQPQTQQSQAFYSSRGRGRGSYSRGRGYNNGGGRGYGNNHNNNRNSGYNNNAGHTMGGNQVMLHRISTALITQNPTMVRIHFMLAMDTCTRTTLLTGPSENGLHSIRLPSLHPLHKVAFSAVRASSDTWHQRLGHPHPELLKSMLSIYSLPVQNKSLSTSCNSCHMGKSSKLHLLSSNFKSNNVLDLIFYDIWGPAPVQYSPSHHGYRCLDPTTDRIYIARHVRFNEQCFPFTTPPPTTPTPSQPSPYVSSFPTPVPSNTEPNSQPATTPSHSPGSKGINTEFDTTAQIIHSQQADWDLARTMLNDEVIRQEARKQQNTSVLAAAAPNTSTAAAQNNRQPPVNHQQTHPNQQQYYRPRGHGRNQSGRGRGGRGRGSRGYSGSTTWAFQNQTGQPTYPQWAWWNTPPYLSAAFNSMNLTYTDPNTVMDTGAEGHVTENRGMISVPDSSPVHTKILVGNGQCLPIEGSGTGFLPIHNRTYILPNILYSPRIIKNLVSVRRFTRDNNVSVEFDSFGFSLKDLRTGRLLSRHNSTGNLYPITPPTLPPQACFLASQSLPWHDRLGHPGAQVLDLLSKRTGGEFDNNAFKTFAAQHGLLFRFSCPQTSSQNGRAERMLRRLNDIIRSLLIHAHLPPSFWVEALHTATNLHNILPSKRLNFFTPTFALYLRHPTCDHLRVFGCACYPNTSATQPHKLHTRSVRCIFLGYPRTSVDTDALIPPPERSQYLVMLPLMRPFFHSPYPPPPLLTLSLMTPHLPTAPQQPSAAATTTTQHSAAVPEPTAPPTAAPHSSAPGSAAAGSS